MPTSVLLQRAERIVTHDANDSELSGGSLLYEGNAISRLIPAGEPLPAAERVLDCRGMVLLPGMINTHHHMTQLLTRALPGVERAPLFDWLRYLYPVWGELCEEAVDLSTRLAGAELLLSGCTTSTDHLYLFPPDRTRLIDIEIAAAREMGIRFHPTRGSMNLGESNGGLPPDRVCQSQEAILEDSQRLIEQYHDPSPHSMCRLGLAPCSPFSVTAELMEKTAELARRHGLMLHTHLAETRDEQEYCLEQFGCRPVEYLERLGWLGPDVWFAHCIHLSEAEIEKFAASGTGVAHCPTSNLRLGSGIAPLRRLWEAGVKVGLAVDGSASNDSSNLWNEARMALLVHRLEQQCERWPLAREVLRLATSGGARLLGREDALGSLEPGKAADIVGVRVDDRLPFVGALHDPVAALVYTLPMRPVDRVIVNGELRVEDGRLVDGELREWMDRASVIAARMLESAPGPR